MTKLNKQQGNTLAKAGNLVQKFKAPGYFSFLKNGSTVNLEVDLLARYLLNLK